MWAWARKTSKAGWISISAVAVAISLCCGLAAAQEDNALKPAPAVTANAELPDSPGALLAASSSANENAADASTVPARNLEDTSVLVPARRNHRVVRPYEEAAPLTAAGKLRLSIMSRLSFGEVGATAFAAGWAQINNGRPHTGTDAGAFGERMEDLAIKQTTQSFLTYGVFAAAFHDDPRYYILGDTKPITRRVLYSALDVVVARKDDGGSAVDWPRFAGIAGATALTNLYYPTVDHGLSRGTQAFFSSVGSAVLNNEWHEFSGDLMHLLPHHRNH